VFQYLWSACPHICELQTGGVKLVVLHKTSWYWKNNEPNIEILKASVTKMILGMN